jgi:hypothetical protein
LYGVEHFVECRENGHTKGFCRNATFWAGLHHCREIQFRCASYDIRVPAAD